MCLNLALTKSILSNQIHLDIEELDNNEKKKLAIAIDDTILGSIGSQTFFGKKSVGFTMNLELGSNTGSVV